MFIAQIEGTEVDVAGHAVFFQRQDVGSADWSGRASGCIGVRVGGEIGQNRFLISAGSWCRNRSSELPRSTPSPSAKPWQRSVEVGELDVVVDAEEARHAIALGAQAGSIAGVIFRLTDIHQRTDFAGLVRVPVFMMMTSMPWNRPRP
jgi:hypothetical protein